MSEEADSAVYQERLVEIFKSCDSNNKGFLSLLEFERLCRQLQLQHQKQRLYKDLGLSRTSTNAKVLKNVYKQKCSISKQVSILMIYCLFVKCQAILVMARFVRQSYSRNTGGADATWR